MSLRDAICLRRDMSLAGRESNKEFISYRIGEADISHLRSKNIERAKRVYRIAARRYIAKAAPSGGFFMVYLKKSEVDNAHAHHAFDGAERRQNIVVDFGVDVDHGVGVFAARFA